MKKPTAPASTVQELDENDLDKIVGGVATAANLKHMDDLIQTDLIGHTTGHSETAAIAGMIAKGAVSAQDAIHAIETGAAQDGKHSADQQLVNLQTALNQIHATPAASAFAAEETKRIGAGTTTADLTRLVNLGAMTEQAAAAALLSEAHASNGSANVGTMMLGLDTKTGGDSVVETALGQLVKSGALSATTTMSVVEAEARGLDHSVDVALANLEIGSGANATINAEIDNRLGFALNFDFIQPGQDYGGVVATDYETLNISTTKTTSALADFIQSGQITVATAVATLETEAKVANISPTLALAALVQATNGNAQVESYIPPLLAKGLMNGTAQADVAMAVYLGNLTPQQAINAITSAAKVAQSSGTQDGLVLPGPAEAQVALAKLSAAVGQLVTGSSRFDATDPQAAALGTHYLTYVREQSALACQTVLEGTYGTAIKRGNAIVSIIADLGAPLAVSVLNYAAGGTAQANSGLPQLLAKGIMNGSAQAEIATAASLGLLTPQQAISATTAAATIAQHSGGKDGLVLPGTAETQVALAKLDAAAQTNHASSLHNALAASYGPAVANGHKILSMITDLGPTLAVSVLNYAAGGAAQANSGLPQLLAKGLINGTAGADIAIAAALGQLTPKQAITVTEAAIALAEHSGGKDGLVLPGAAETQVALANLDAAARKHGATDLHNMLAASYGPTIARGGAIVSMLNELGTTISVSVLNYVAGGTAETNSGLPQLLAKGLISGTSEDDIARAAALGLLNPQQAINVCSAAVSLAQHSGGKDGLVLPGPAEAEVVLAKLNAAALQFQASALHDALNKTYGIAIAAGNAFIPMIADLGPTVTVQALTVGLGLAATAGPTTGTEATLIVGLEATAKAAGVSVDEALTMASLYAVGHSQVLKVEMTERILDGTAAANLAALAATGKISATTATTILINEVGSLAASSPNNSALGFDRATATGLALARLDLAAVALQGNSKTPASEVIGAQNLQAAIEGDYTRDILVGLGAIIGLVEGGASGSQSLNEGVASAGGGTTQALNDIASAITGIISGSPARALDPASAALVNAAQALINHLLPTALGINIATDAVAGSVTQDEVTSSVDDDVNALTNAYSSAYQLASFEKEWTSSNPSTEGEVPKDISASLQTYNFTEVGVNIDVSASTTIPFGNGFSLSLSAHAGAEASASVNATQVTVAAAASASAQAEIDLGGHAKIVMLTQAIASGAVSVGVTGVTVQANVAVGASVSISQTEQGSLGNGFDGMESTTLTIGTVAGANAGGSIGLKNQLSFGAQVGIYASAGVTGDFSFGGVTVGGGATILSPGTVGVSADVGVDFSGGNITINLNAFIGVELFGVAFNLNLTIPTGAIVDALSKLGTEIGSGVVQAADGLASAFKSLGGSFDSLGKSLENSFESFGDDITNIY